MIRVRVAKPSDASGIARVHVQSWRETYRGIVPDEHLANLSASKREVFWRDLIENPKQASVVWVATNEDGEVIGFANGGKSRESDLPFVGEVYAIYLLQDYKGRGIGRMLFESLIDSLKREGLHSMMLWVLKDNTTIGFYQHLGGQFVRSKQVEIGGVFLEESAIGWSEI